MTDVTYNLSFLKRFGRALSLGLAFAIGAVMLAVSHSSTRYWWLGWITLVPFFLAIRLLRPGFAAIGGAFWGVSFYVTSGVIAGGNVPHNWLSLALLVAIPAVYACLGSAVTRRKGFHPILLGLGWAGVELALRPLSLHYGLLAATQGESTFLLAAGSIGGYVFVAFLVALANAWILKVLTSLRVVITPARMICRAPDRELLLPFWEQFIRSTRFLFPVQPRAPPAALS